MDAESEHLVQAALKKAMVGRTTVVIAHRLSTIRDADNIVVLNKGKVAESGTHNALVEAGGIYSKMVSKQREGAESG